MLLQKSLFHFFLWLSMYIYHIFYIHSLEHTHLKFTILYGRGWWCTETITIVSKITDHRSAQQIQHSWKSVKYCKNYRMWCRDTTWANAVGKMAPFWLARHRVATNLQLLQKIYLQSTIKKQGMLVFLKRPCIFKTAPLPRT